MVKFFGKKATSWKCNSKRSRKKSSRARALNEMGLARLFARLEARVTNSISVKAAPVKSKITGTFDSSTSSILIKIRGFLEVDLKQGQKSHFSVVYRTKALYRLPEGWISQWDREHLPFTLWGHFLYPFLLILWKLRLFCPKLHSYSSIFIRKSEVLRTSLWDLIKDALLRERKRKSPDLGGIRTHSLLSFCCLFFATFCGPTVVENSCSENYSEVNSKSSLNIATLYFVGYIFLLTGLKTYGRRQLCRNINLTICVAQFWKKSHQAGYP